MPDCYDVLAQALGNFCEFRVHNTMNFTIFPPGFFVLVVIWCLSLVVLFLFKFPGLFVELVLRIWWFLSFFFPVILCFGSDLVAASLM